MLRNSGVLGFNIILKMKKYVLCHIFHDVAFYSRLSRLLIYHFQIITRRVLSSGSLLDTIFDPFITRTYCSN